MLLRQNLQCATHFSFSFLAAPIKIFCEPIAKFIKACARQMAEHGEHRTPQQQIV
jgi:hypothetical protein